jgi:hypothetical protein
MINEPKIISDGQVYADARAKWGDAMQIDVAIEELAELIAILIQNRRTRVGEFRVCEEIADVHIVIEQLIQIFGKDKFREMRAVKMRRLWERIHE